MNNANSIWVTRPVNASLLNQADSMRSFVTESSSEDHDVSMASNKSEKRKISPVFQDYGTAHSLITSGKAKNLTSPERKHFRSGSDGDSESDSVKQLELMNKRRVNEKSTSDLKASPVEEYTPRDFGNLRHGVVKGDDNEDEVTDERMSCIATSPTFTFGGKFSNVRHGVLKGGDDEDEGSHQRMSRIPVTPAFVSKGNFGNVRRGVLKEDDDEDDGQSQIPKMQFHPSSPLERNGRQGVLKLDDDASDGRVSPLHDEASRIKRPQTPLVPQLWNLISTNSANRPPILGGRLDSVQWPSNNPYNEHSPYNTLSRKSSGILSPTDHGFAQEAYPPSAYGNVKNPFYSSPHGIPSPIASKSGSGSSGEPRSSYPYPRSSFYPAVGIRPDDDEDAKFENKQMEKNIVYDQPSSHYTQQQYSEYSRSPPQQSEEGSTVNHILDHYTNASDGSYYTGGAKGTTTHNYQTPTTSRRLDLAQHGSAAVTPSTDEDRESDLILRRFPNVPSPAYIGADSSSNRNYRTCGDSHELLGSYEESEKRGDSMLFPPKPIHKNRQGGQAPPAILGRQVSHALRDSTMYDDSHIEVSSPVIKKPVAVQKKMKLRERKPIDGFQKVKNIESTHNSAEDGTIRRNDPSQDSSNEPNNDKENIPPISRADIGISSDRFVEDFRIETVAGQDGLYRKISRRRPVPAPVDEEDDDQDEWTTVIEESGSTSPDGKIPFSDDRGVTYRPRYKQAGSSIANNSDAYYTSSPGAVLGPYITANRAMIHPARGDDQYEKHARPLPGALPGLGNVYLPVPEQRKGGGFGSNAFRTPAKVFRSLSQHLSSPLGSSSPRHEYHELANVKKGASSPYSPPRDVKNVKGKGKAPMRKESASERAAREHGVRLKPPAAAWMDGPKSSKGSENSAEGFQFGKKQRPERPDSYIQAARAANNGRLPKFMMTSSPSPDPEREWIPDDQRQFPRTPQIAYPPAIHSTTESIADYSDDEVSYIDSLDGPEYDHTPASVPYNRTMDARYAAGIISPQTDTTYADRSGASQKPLAPGGLYNAFTHNTLLDRYGSKQRKARFAKKQAAEADLEAGITQDPNVITIPQDTKRLRGLKLKPGPSIVQPRSHHEFRYRSPLAPIQSMTWERMYSTRKLQKINNRINDLRVHTEVVRPPHIAHVTPNGTRMTNANEWQVAPVSPHLQGHQHDDSSVGGFAGQKEKISTVVLVLCAIPINPFMPILLVLYASGLLDWVMNNYTKGDVRHFGHSQKKSALMIAGAYFAMGIIALVTVIVVKERQEDH